MRRRRDKSKTNMADKGGKTSAVGVKPYPMKLFATWEIEKSSPNCIPRLCSLTLTRLVILKALENDLNSVILAVKMQSSKRILRSNEIILSAGGLLDTEIDLSFSLQYPHFLKRDGNKLQVMLQRRKKYKNRTILGYKTLAIGVVNMAQVLQRSVDRELNLYSDPKERTNKVAQVTVLSLSSQPVDHEENGRMKMRGGDVDRSPDVDMSDDEEGEDFQENWSNDELSDSEAPEEEARSSRPRKSSHRGPTRAAVTRINAQRGERVRLKRRRSFLRRISQAFHPGDQDDQDILDKVSEEMLSKSEGEEEHPEQLEQHRRNLKQRFMSLLRRFRVSESSDEESTPDEFPASCDNVPPSDLHMEDLHLLEQRNIKQKFISLLRRFRVSEEVLDSEQDQDICDVEPPGQREIQELFEDLEDLSDSGPEMDTISVLSTPKPKLRPFFTGRVSGTEILDVPRLSPIISRNGNSLGLIGPQTSAYDDFGLSLQESARLSDESSKRHDSDSHLDTLTDQEMSDTPIPGPGPVSQSASPAIDNKFGRGPPSLAPPLDERFNRAVSLEEKPPGPGSAPEDKSGSIAIGGFDDKPIMSSASASPHTPYSSRVKHVTPDVARSKSMLSKQRVITVERRNSAGNFDGLPRKVLLDQLSSVLSSDDSLPESFILVNTTEWQGQLLAQVLQEPHHRVICTCSSADVKATISFVVNKIQKFCNSNSRDPAPLKIGMAGGDFYVNQVLRPYVEQFSAKSHDWWNYIKFLYIPLGSSSLGKYLGSLDAAYNTLFCDAVWKETFEKSENQRMPDSLEIAGRVSQYMNGTCSVVQIPIAEAMITYKEKSTDEESSQIFVPFLTEVRIGPIDLPGGPSSSVDLEDTNNPPQAPGLLSSSPPQSMQMEKTKENHTPPSSPNVNHPGILGTTLSSLTSPINPPSEYLELQLDYWTIDKGLEVGPKDKLVKKDSKSSLKTTFKSVQVFRLPQANNGDSIGALSMMVVTREKKQKIMRIGKKSKEGESKSQLVEGISRLICTSKSQSHPLTVTIDGVDWSGVKFFQVSSQWQTHIKHIPMLLMSHVESPL